MKELVINAAVENLPTVIEFIENELDESVYSMKLKHQLNIVVEEIFVNIANYAYEPDTGDAVIRLRADDEITIEFEDRGVPYNPLEKDDPDITLSDDERQIGGLGIFMVKNMMDYVDYKNKDGKNILTIKKFIPDES